MSIHELFGNEEQEVVASARQLSGTAELTKVSSHIATSIIRSMEEQIEIYRDRIPKTAMDSKEMDALLDEFKPWPEIEEDSVLRNLDEDTVESMLKSQQSKRSRTKGKSMTLDNYRALMTATIAERILRELYNKPKQHSFASRRASLVDFTPAQLEALEADQEALRREIRNLQSKKSIMRSKADFDESSEAWLALLKAEQMLKDLRVGRSSTVVEVDKTRDKLAEMLEGVDLEHLRAADSKELLQKIKELTAGDETTEPADDEMIDG